MLSPLSERWRRCDSDARGRQLRASHQTPMANKLSPGVVAMSLGTKSPRAVLGRCTHTAGTNGVADHGQCKHTGEKGMKAAAIREREIG